MLYGNCEDKEPLFLYKYDIHMNDTKHKNKSYKISNVRQVLKCNLEQMLQLLCSVTCTQCNERDIQHCSLGRHTTQIHGGGKERQQQ